MMMMMIGRGGRPGMATKAHYGHGGAIALLRSLWPVLDSLTPSIRPSYTDLMTC